MNFDIFIDRHGTNSLKYDFMAERGKPDSLLPMWVADMDFQTAPAILGRLEKTVKHGIFGYSETKEDYYNAVNRWYERHFDWHIEKEWMIKTPGVVFALAVSIRAFTKEGDGVLLQQPVYYPFSEVILDNDRTLVNSALRLVDGHYEMDFEDFERKIIDYRVKLFILCSPHNPVGRVWKEWELKKVGDICRKYGVIVVSDEIHSDFIYPAYKHYVFANLGPEYADIAVTCTSPSKTFNLAGLQISNIFISNPELRREYLRTVAAAGYSQANLMGIVACQAAYEAGEEWLLGLKEYLYGNLTFLKDYLREYLPEIRLIEPEGTYLIWLDFRGLNMTEAERERLIVEKAGLWLDSGAMFGPDGDGFERVNIACPRETLRRALCQLEKAVHPRIR